MFSKINKGDMMFHHKLKVDTTSKNKGLVYTKYKFIVNKKEKCGDNEIIEISEISDQSRIWEIITNERKFREFSLGIYAINYLYTDEEFLSEETLIKMKKFFDEDLKKILEIERRNFYALENYFTCNSLNDFLKVTIEKDES